MSRKRIAVITLSTGKARLMLSGVQDGAVHIVECKNLPSNIKELNKTLHKRLDALRRQGFIVIVDEVLPNFAKHGRAVRLDGESASGTPIVVEAMKAYQNLKKFQSISFPANAGGMMEISETLYNEVRGNDGKVQYRIDWHSIKPESVALLLTVYTAVNPSLGDAQSFSDFLNVLGQGSGHQQQSPMNRFSNIIKATNERMLSTDPLERALRGEHE
ncbi:hypothetical protein [Vibrio alginolyticus]|uniref:hypothetical protein n=1 Tax=Vibrio alginolyticus TaxID=663 RepID=UPI003753EDEF